MSTTTRLVNVVATCYVLVGLVLAGGERGDRMEQQIRRPAVLVNATVLVVVGLLVSPPNTSYGASLIDFMEFARNGAPYLLLR